MTNYKMIALDLDDTLLRDDLTISRQNKQAITKAIKKGVKVVIATGRQFESALPYVKELGLDVPVISCQGAMVKSAIDHKILYHRPVPLTLAKSIVAQGDEQGIYMQLYNNDGYFIEKQNKYSNLYGELTGVYGQEVGKLGKFINFEPLKLLFIDEPETIKEKHKIYQQQYGNQLNVFITKPFYLEFTNLEATKGHALTDLCARYSITMDDVIAVGDSQNDIHMLQMSGLGVAVDNARDDVKEHADTIAPSNMDNGVAYVINKYLLEA